MSSHFINQNIKEKIKKLPDRPGIYIMRGADGGIIYIGKAISLKKRVSSYFQNKGRMDSKTLLLVNDIVDFECLTVKSEEEALLLEARLIRDFQPKYNISLKDDKRYPMIRLSVNEEFPRFSVVRFQKNDGAQYFGPFSDARGLRKTLRLMQAIFKIRGCQYFRLKESHAKHCMYNKINACLRPCLGKISKEDYGKIIDDIVTILKGDSTFLIYSLKREMKQASMRQDYETAAKIRDSVAALKSVLGSHVRNINIYRRIAPDLKKGIDELRKALGMARAPMMIEAIDVSNISGTLPVGAMVVFKNGVPYKDGYRRFRIRDVDGIDDYQMIREVVRRRYSKLLKEKKQLPDLVLIDGGKGHLATALCEARDMGLSGVFFAGIAKENEEIFIPSKSDPIVLDRSSPALLLVEHIRDEAHRFAIEYHRRIRDKRIKESILDDIPDIGKKRKKSLLTYFGSVANMKEKYAEELARAPGISIKLAKEVLEYLHK